MGFELRFNQILLNSIVLSQFGRFCNFSAKISDLLCQEEHTWFLLLFLSVFKYYLEMTSRCLAVSTKHPTFFRNSKL